MKPLTVLLLALCAPLWAEVVSVPHPAVGCANGSTVVWTAAMQSAFDRMLGSKSLRVLDRVDLLRPLRSLC